MPQPALSFIAHSSPCMRYVRLLSLLVSVLICLSRPLPHSSQSKLFTLDFPALASVVLLSLILMRSTADSSLFNMLVTGLNVVLIIFVLCAGFPYTNTDNYSPFTPFGTHGIFTGGWVLLLWACSP